MPEVRTLVWDLGGVLLRWQPDLLVRQALAHLAADDAAAAALAHRLFEDFIPQGDWSQFDRGVIGLDELADRMARRTGLSPGDVRALLDAVPDHLAFEGATVALLRRARAAGNRVVYLSNMPAPYAAWLDGDEEFRGWFDAGVFSSDVGCVKPEPEIFDVAARRLDLDAATTTLIDDRSVNVDQARRHGWSGIQFTDATQCAAELTRLGWL